MNTYLDFKKVSLYITYIKNIKCDINVKYYFKINIINTYEH